VHVLQTEPAPQPKLRSQTTFRCKMGQQSPAAKGPSLIPSKGGITMMSFPVWKGKICPLIDQDLDEDAAFFCRPVYHLLSSAPAAVLRPLATAAPAASAHRDCHQQYKHAVRPLVLTSPLRSGDKSGPSRFVLHRREPAQWTHQAGPGQSRRAQPTHPSSTDRCHMFSEEKSRKEPHLS